MMILSLSNKGINIENDVMFLYSVSTELHPAGMRGRMRHLNICIITTGLSSADEDHVIQRKAPNMLISGPCAKIAWSTICLKLYASSGMFLRG